MDNRAIAPFLSSIVFRVDSSSLLCTAIDATCFLVAATLFFRSSYNPSFRTRRYTREEAVCDRPVERVKLQGTNASVYAIERAK